MTSTAQDMELYLLILAQSLREKVLGVQCLAKINRQKIAFVFAYLLEFLFLFHISPFGNSFHVFPAKEALILPIFIILWF